MRRRHLSAQRSQAPVAVRIQLSIEDEAAAKTAQVMMGRYCGVKANSPVVIEEAQEQTGLHQPAQVLVDRRHVYRLALGSQPGPDLFRPRMIDRGPDEREDESTRSGRAKASSSQLVSYAIIRAG